MNLESDLNFDVENCLISCGLVDQSIWGERYDINSVVVVSEEVESDAVVLEVMEEVLGVMIAVDFFMPSEADDDTAAASSRGRFFDDAAESSTFFFLGAKNEVIMMLDWWIGYGLRKIDVVVLLFFVIVNFVIVAVCRCNMNRVGMVILSIMLHNHADFTFPSTVTIF